MKLFCYLCSGTCFIRFGRVSAAFLLLVTFTPISNAVAQDPPPEAEAVTSGVSEVGDRIADELRAAEAELYFASGVSWSEELGEKVIYGEDDRREVYELTDGARDKLLRALADSTCLITSASRVELTGDAYHLDLKPWMAYRRYPACSGEKFGTQQVGGWCSGFLVGSNLVATAGHCGKTQQEIRKTAYIFGFYAHADGTSPSQLHPGQVYFGKRLVAHELSNQGDYAVVELDRNVVVPGAVPLPIRRDGEAKKDTPVGVIGYPAGLPAKVAFGETTKVYRTSGPWLEANLDTYGGNSGSAVFNTNGVVEGILVRGKTDYIIHDSTCFFSNRVPDSDAGETVTKASVFRQYVPAK